MVDQVEGNSREYVDQKLVANIVQNNYFFIDDFLTRPRIEECCPEIHNDINQENEVNKIVKSIRVRVLIVQNPPAIGNLHGDLDTVIKRKYYDHDIPLFPQRMILFDDALL